MYDEINIISDLNLDYLQKYFEYDNTILFFGKICNSKTTLDNNTVIEYKKEYIVDNIQSEESHIYNLFDISIEDIQKII